jgi:hypothetical protein
MSKQFNITGLNGVYLTHKPTETVTSINYKDQLIRDYDFYPNTKSEANSFILKNVIYDDKNLRDFNGARFNAFAGSNSITKSNSTIRYSEIHRKNHLIPNQVYYNSFKFYFRFYGSDLGTFTRSGWTSTQTKNFYNRLRVKLYAQLGSKLVSLNLDNLQYHVEGSEPYLGSITGDTKYSVTNKAGIRLTTGENGEDCIDMGYSGATYMELFDSYQFSPNGYNFGVNVKLPDFEQTAEKTKDYKIIVKYYNIAVTDAPSLGLPYTASETIEHMSDVFTYFVPITVPEYTGSYAEAEDPEEAPL